MSETDRRSCSRCGAENDAASRFCSNCGASLIAEERAGAEPESLGYERASGGYVSAPGASEYQPYTPAAEVIDGYEIASAWLRLAAWIVDGFVCGAVALVGVNVFGSGSLARGIEGPGFLYFVLILAYPALILWMVANRGQSPGKIVVGIKIVRRDGRTIGFGLAILREWIGKFISGVILYLGFIWILFDAKRQGWHDKLADTVVVKVR